MKLYTEITPGGEEEVIIRCSERTEEIRQIEKLISNVIKGAGELRLSLGNTEYYIPKSQILFFETDGGKVVAHTPLNMYYTELKLFELEQILPIEFVRVSKSTIVNTKHIISVTKELTGSGEARFGGTNKKIYFSRNYYKILKDRIEETRNIYGGGK